MLMHYIAAFCATPYMGLPPTWGYPLHGATPHMELPPTCSYPLRGVTPYMGLPPTWGYLLPVFTHIMWVSVELPMKHTNKALLLVITWGHIIQEIAWLYYFPGLGTITLYSRLSCDPHLCSCDQWWVQGGILSIFITVITYFHCTVLLPVLPTDNPIDLHVGLITTLNNIGSYPCSLNGYTCTLNG